MESYGELLQKTRERKALDLDRVSREISIEKRYIQGLEAEDNSVFPGDAYMVGFLKNYADYLDLDSEFLLKLYRNKQIQEAPLPQGLYERQKPKFFLPAIIIPSVFFVAVIAVVLSLLVVKKKHKIEEGVIVSNSMKNRQFELTEKKFSGFIKAISCLFQQKMKEKSFLLFAIRFRLLELILRLEFITSSLQKNLSLILTAIIFLI